MAAKKARKFARIFQWVEAKDPELANAIRDLCKEGALAGGRRAGATFLFPPAEVRKDIIDKTYSADAEDAVRLLDAHIIPSAVRTAAEFKTGVGSLLGIRLEVESSSGTAVTLKGGAALKTAGDFSARNLAVWRVEAGAVPLEGAPFEFPRRGRGGEPRGGRPRARASFDSARVELARKVEAAWDRHMRTREGKDPYLTCVVSILNFLKMHHADALTAVFPMLDRDPAVSFYLLVEPYKSVPTDFVLDASLLFGPDGWAGAEIYVMAASEFSEFFESPAQFAGEGKGPAPFAFRKVGDLRKEIDSIRLSIVGEDCTLPDKFKTPAAVKNVYNKLQADNTIGGFSPVFTTTTQALLKNSKKLWQDELRFIVHHYFQDLRSNYDPQEFGALLEVLSHGRPGNDYVKEASITDADRLRTDVAPADAFTLLIKFINSTDFLYFPVANADVGDSWGDVPVSAGLLDSRDLTVVSNTEGSKQKYLEALAAADTPRRLTKGESAAARHYELMLSKKTAAAAASAAAEETAAPEEDVEPEPTSRRAGRIPKSTQKSRAPKTEDSDSQEDED